MAAIEYRGANAVTNFDISNYVDRLKKKGIPLDRILQEPPRDPHCCSPESEDADAEVEQPPPMPPPPPPKQQGEEEEEEEMAVPSSRTMLPPAAAACMDTSSSMIAAMEDPMGGGGGHDDFNWGFCLDSVFSSVVVPELPLENAGELPDLFDDRGAFEDNIDLIFETCSYGAAGGGAHVEYASSDASGSGVEEGGVSADSSSISSVTEVEEVVENGKEASAISCNFSV